MYAPVSAMRSTRYPLAGLGCGCSAPAAVSGLGCGCGAPAPMAGLGQLMTAATSLAAGFSIAGAGATGLILGYFLGKHAQRVGLAWNGRRRRSRR